MPRRASTPEPTDVSPAESANADTRRILDALRRIVRDLRQPNSATPALGPARLFVLQQLAEHGELGVGELARLTHTDPSSVSVVVHELVRAGLVTRRQDTADRRRSLLSPTAAGRSAIAKVPPAAQHRLAAAIDGLGPTRRRTLARLLGEVVSATGSDPRAPLFFEDEPR